MTCLRMAEVCHNTLVDFTGEEAFEAADDLASGPAASRPAGDVVDRRLVEPHADDDRAMEGGVGLSVPTPDRDDAGRSVIPDEAGIGQAPHSFAKAASERIRSGLSPKMISIWAAVWAPTPKPSRRVGDVSVVRRVRCWSCIAISSVRAIQRRASARRVCLAAAVGVSRGPGRSPAQRVSRP